MTTPAPYAETWYCARYDDGRSVEDIHLGYTATTDPETIIEAVTDYGDEPATLYRAVVTWEPLKSSPRLKAGDSCP